MLRCHGILMGGSRIVDQGPWGQVSGVRARLYRFRRSRRVFLYKSIG
jgi:hypothetical protein